MTFLTHATLMVCGALLVAGGLRLLDMETGWLSRAFGAASGPTAGGNASLLEAGQAAAAAELSEILKAELRRNPTGSLYWLWLAQLRQAEDSEGFNAALQLSLITGRREGAIMLERAIAGLAAWPILTPQSRRTTIADLVGVLPQLNRQPLERVKAAIAAQSPGARQEIAAALAAEDRQGRYAKRLGL